jgi:hypothetical protein
MSEKTHIYKFEKGSTEKTMGQEITWPVYTTPEEAIKAGAFDSMDTIMRYANAQLNIKKGHAAQRASKQKIKKNEDGTTSGVDGSTLSLAALADVARKTVATATERTRDGLSQKEAAKRARTLQKNIQEKKASLSPETIAELRAAGFDVGDVAPASSAAPTKGRGK